MAPMDVTRTTRVDRQTPFGVLFGNAFPVTDGLGRFPRGMGKIDFP